MELQGEHEMDEQAAALLDALSAEELAALEEEAKAKLAVFLKHVVGIAGAYEHIGPGGARKPMKPFYYSSAVVEVRGQWYLATAGHNLEKMDAAVSRSDMRLVACGLDDTHASSARHQVPIDCFDYASSKRFWRHQDDVDFGLVHLHKNCCDLLSANGIEPLTAEHWNPSKVAECDTFLMAGFPENAVHSGIAFASTHYNARVKGHPCILLVDRQAPGADEGRFVGQIRREHVESIVGMSGGPIFGIQKWNLKPYFVAAIQSSRVRSSTTTFGFPIPRILELAKEFLASTTA